MGHAPPVDTLIAGLQWRATHQGDRVAYTHLEDGDRPRDLTYAALWARAGDVAAALGDRRGERVLLMFEEGLDYLAALFGAMRAGALACPVHPPDPKRLARTLPRLQTIARDAGVTVVLTSNTIREAALPAVGDDPTLSAASWLAVETLPPGQPVDAVVGPDDLAYLQYTSGSTSTPKGVMISHRNLVHQLTDFDVGYDHGPDSVMVTWLPATHDLGLVYGRFMPMWMGFRCVFLSPADFMRRPIAWLDAMSRYKGTHAPSPNFGYEVAARKATPQDIARLDLRSVRVLLNGAEPIRSESERAFVETFAPAGLNPAAMTHAMGMSEATAKIITEPIDRHPPKFVTIDGVAYERNEVVIAAPGSPHSREVASNGTTVLDTVVAVVDPDTCTIQPPGRVGEMWVRGTTVAQGYWNQPEATEATFRARASDGSGPWLRTGDLAFILDGEVYLSGRLKDLLIIRGQNHHPQDIEWTILAASSDLRPNCAAVFGWRDETNEERVGVVAEIVTERVHDPEPLFAAIRNAASEHGLALATIGLLPERALPKTSSGKIQRNAAREAWLSGSLTARFRWDAPRVQPPEAPTPAVDDLSARLDAAKGRRRQTILVDAIRAEVAQLMGYTPADVDADRPFGELGLDSVTAVDLVERMGRRLGLTLPGTALFDHPTPQALAGHLLERRDARPRVHAPAAVEPASAPDVSQLDDDAVLAELAELLKR